MRPGFPAAKSELANGDVILAINQKPVADIDEFQKLYEASIKARDPRVLVEAVRNRGHQSHVLKISYDTDK